MRKHGWKCCLLLLALVTEAARAQSRLEEILDRMDRDAAAFRDMIAGLTKVAYTAVLSESSTESGTIRMKRASSRALMKVEIVAPDARAVALEGTTAQIYYPKIQTVQVYDLGKSRALVDQFSLLGFGTRRRELERNYAIRLTGEETLDGRRAVRLELEPKSPQVREQVQKIELWIPEDAGYPLQQRFWQPGGDYYLIRYHDLRVNVGLSDSDCRLKLPPGVRREYPQK
ncbi:MAG: outer membrane lipoprotein carrier protein LolA [Bryobacterales bacterium]|nr:outer membrane lipoprotein carrier protein LolA [Bryobacteraceae bacterium]MDW8130347.1 outer membrane lipoprotein carrier protein LolA [Bryobacterales bacterium]